MTHITIEREKLERVLEALEVLIMKHYELTGEVLHKETYAVLEETLAQPPQRTWVGLTAAQRKEIERQSVYVDGAIRMTEAKLKGRTHD